MKIKSIILVLIFLIFCNVIFIKKGNAQTLPVLYSHNDLRKNRFINNELFTETNIFIKHKTFSDRETKPTFFRQSFGGNILGIGNRKGLNTGLGIYYAPRFVFNVKDNNSFSIGMSIHMFLTKPGSGFIPSLSGPIGFSSPIMVGYNFGNFAIDESGEGIGAFIEVGVGEAVLVKARNNIFFFGPSSDFGLRIRNRWEIRFSVSINGKDFRNGYLFGGGAGITI